MISFQPIIERIKALLEQDTEASVTYAALEARLALERFVYDRLRQRHDYISHEQLRKWQPGEIVKTLLLEVDENATQTTTLMMSTKPHVERVEPAEEDFITVGTEIGFDARKIARMWQALANLALHIRQPRHRSDDIPEYGDKANISSKVHEVLAELERFAAGTMTFSGIPTGGEISFTCSCGEKNRRRASFMTHGKLVYCINPNCSQTWKVTVEGSAVNFEIVLVDVPCKECGALNHIPWRTVTKMKYDQIIRYPCQECKGENLVKWCLMQEMQTT